MNRKIGRNDSCPCGRKKLDGSPVKYKYCHLGKEAELLRPPRVHQSSGIVFGTGASQMSLYERNVILIEGIIDIFSFDGKKKWQEIKRNISRDHIRELYKLVAWLWPPDTNISTILPRPENKLRSLYLGWMRPESVLNSVVRYSLYCDEILVMNPFINPWCIREEYNPLDHPEEYISDTIKWVFFVLQLAPWIFDRHVILIPHPEDFDYKLRMETWKLAEKRMNDLSKEDERELARDPQLEKYHEEDQRRMWLATPTDAMREKIKDFDPKMPEHEIEDMLRYIEKEKERDPYYPTNPNEKGTFGMHIAQTGGNLEMGLFLAQMTGSYLYTDFAFRWKEILSVGNEGKNNTTNDWSSITLAFQKLDFKFLDKTTPKFASRIRNEGRLESMRNFLRSTWLVVAGESGKKVTPEIIRTLTDNLVEEYHKAQSEWGKIDKDLAKWVLSEGGAGSLLTAGMDWKLPALGFSMTAIGNLLASRFDRKRFRANTPLSVFIDLNKHKKSAHGGLIKRIFKRARH